MECDGIVAVPKPEPAESDRGRADRYERALKAIAASKLVGPNFVDWVQSVCEDVLEGLEAECWNCDTPVHEGPCVGEEPEEE